MGVRFHRASETMKIGAAATRYEPTRYAVWLAAEVIIGDHRSVVHNMIAAVSPPCVVDPAEQADIVEAERLRGRGSSVCWRSTALGDLSLSVEFLFGNLVEKEARRERKGVHPIARDARKRAMTASKIFISTFIPSELLIYIMHFHGAFV